MSGVRMFTRKPAGAPDGGEFAKESSAPTPLPPPAAPAVTRDPIVATPEQLAAINGPYDTLKPPYPQFGAQILDFWSKAEIREQDLALMVSLCHAHGLHPSFAEVLLRSAWASRDTLLMKEQRDQGSVTEDARVVWTHKWSCPDGVARTCKEISDLHPWVKTVRGKGLEHALELTKPSTVIADGSSVFVDGLVQTTSTDASRIAGQIDRDARRRTFDAANNGD